MECELARENLSAWLDGELDPHTGETLELHLAACGECRSLADALRGQDAELSRAFEPGRAAAERLAAEVSEQWMREPVETRPAVASPFFGHWSALLLAVAAGFLLAVGVFQPWRGDEPAVAIPPATPSGPPVTAPPIARVIEATGPVEIRAPGENAWQCKPQLDAFACPSDSTLKTGPNVRCEVKTSAGCVIRLNEETEVTLTAADSVSIHRGQISCSPSNTPLRVRSVPPKVAPSP